MTCPLTCFVSLFNLKIWFRVSYFLSSLVLCNLFYNSSISASFNFSTSWLLLSLCLFLLLIPHKVFWSRISRSYLHLIPYWVSKAFFLFFWLVWTNHHPTLHFQELRWNTFAHIIFEGISIFYHLYLLTFFDLFFVEFWIFRGSFCDDLISIFI